MPDPTCTRYFLNPDGSLRPVEAPGHCVTYWRLREQALAAWTDAGVRETQIKLRLHERRCPHCSQYYADCERYSLDQLKG